MGFRKVTPSVFYFDNNGTFYVVSFKSGTFRLAMRDAAPQGDGLAPWVLVWLLVSMANQIMIFRERRPETFFIFKICFRLAGCPSNPERE